jgi:hypothetical protein
VAGPNQRLKLAGAAIGNNNRLTGLVDIQRVAGRGHSRVFIEQNATTDVGAITALLSQRPPGANAAELCPSAAERYSNGEPELLVLGKEKRGHGRGHGKLFGEAPVFPPAQVCPLTEGVLKPCS